MRAKDFLAPRFLIPAGLLVLAVLFRAAALYYTSLTPLFSQYMLDAKVYHAAGLSFVQGDWLLGDQVFHLSPLYCYFIGVFYFLFGDGPWPVHLAQLLMGASTVVLIYDMGRRLFGNNWAWLAGLAACFYGPFIFYEQFLLLATMTTFLHGLLLWCTIRGIEKGDVSFLQWFLTGIVLGLTALARPTALLLVVPYAIVLLRVKVFGEWKVRWRILQTIAVGAAIMILPVTVRNLLVSGEFVLLQDKGGMNFYLGNGPHATGSHVVPPDIPKAATMVAQVALFRERAEQEVGRRLSANECDGYWFDKTWEAIGADPMRWIRLMGTKVLLYFNAQEISNNYDYDFTATLNPLFNLPLVRFSWMVPLSLLGTWILLIKRRKDEEFLAWQNLFMCLGVVIFFVVSRYRVPAVPGLILAAVAGLRFLFEK